MIYIKESCDIIISNTLPKNHNPFSMNGFVYIFIFIDIMAHFKSFSYDKS